MTINSIIERLRDIRWLRNFLYTLAILISIFFLIRNSLVQIIFENKCTNLKNRYGIAIEASRIGFSGVRTIYVNKLTAKPDGCDTLFSINRAEVKLNFIDLVLLKVNPLEIWLSSIKFNFVGENKSSNYYFLFGNHLKSSEIQTSSNEAEYSRSRQQYAIYRVLKGIFGLTTASYHVKDFSFNYSDSTYSTQILVPEFESNEKGFDTQIEVREDGRTNYIHFNGLANKKQSNLILKASMIGGKRPLPLLNHKLGLNISFDTLDLRIFTKELSQYNIHLVVNSSVSSLDFFSERLSDQIIKVQHGEFNIDITVNPDYYLIDSSSTLDLNGLNAKFLVNYFPAKDRSFSFKIATDEFTSQQLFNSLPEGLFNNLKGIKSSGTIKFSLDLGVKLNMPDSVYLEPKLITENFSIKQYGYRNFSALNDTFSHDVYDEGQFVKTIHIGGRNNEFRSLKQISPLIIDAIITSEDGGFFNNNGFDIDAFKFAISENIKQKRFARGGSTITMQLIKNLYLNKNKNIFRKAEEYLIVWLIGSQGIVSKERMLEIYLNIIEWGPNVYGVTEACRYYFEKDPNEVTLDEAIYLASVIPRPKKFKYLFEKDGNLKSFMESDFNFISTKMFQREMITEEQLNALIYNVTLTGRAKEMLFDTTAMAIDSLGIDEIRVDTTLLLP